MGFTSPPLGDGLSTGPIVLWMENAETVDVVLVSVYLQRIYLGGTENINCRIGRIQKRS